MTLQSAVAADAGIPVHEQVYRQLRERILFGGFLPGKAVTLRGLADELGVSAMPVREAVRRLIAENALELHGNRRVSIPDVSQEIVDEIWSARRLLEVELASKALLHLGDDDIKALQDIDDQIDLALETGDVEGYMRGNYEFHFYLYSKSRSEVLIKLVKNLWVQFGPFMRLVYGRSGTANLEDQHKQALEALKARDQKALQTALEEDIAQGMGFIRESLSLSEKA
ncbi:transcriptional regulator, GntR family [Pseudovibrio denitrificans]|uniref:Transcriptional regulator, GntR family n=2 Tax=Pseudovibrio denitrificans TaxID=258256 RepID=A0A1I7BM45_9HYPH|nr:GntR family transcriptional regulator [Pseudovibrio denitrificans]SFT88226.1 transcriptional regulator, GntR family [Pseudovibrio denitrificans]